MCWEGGGDGSWEEGARIKGRCLGYPEETRRKAGVAVVSEGSCPLPLGCVVEGLAVRGLSFGCGRIRSDPIRAWAVGFAPLPGAAGACPAPVGTRRRPRDPSPPRTRHWRRNARGSVRPGLGSFPQRELGLPPPAALPSPAPKLRVSGPPPPCSPRGGWVPRRWGRARTSPPLGGLARPAALPPVHLSANATRGAVLRTHPRYSTSVCLGVQSRGSVCPRQADRAGQASELRAAGRARRAGWGRR